MRSMVKVLTLFSGKFSTKKLFKLIQPIINMTMYERCEMNVCQQQQKNEIKTFA